MQIYLKYLFAATISLVNGAEVRASTLDIHHPYAQSNPNKLSHFGGYCKDPSDERRLWAEINKFSKSTLQAIPRIPPDQKAYIRGEWESGNSNRAIQITYSPFYKMSDLIEKLENIEKLSTNYLAQNTALPLEMKMETIGRMLINIQSESIQWDETDGVAADLERKGYKIQASDLRLISGILRSLRTTIATHLICYGENLGKRRRPE